MRDYSQIDLIDMCRRKDEVAASNDNGPEVPAHSPVIDWFGARKPLHLILMACTVIAGMRCLVEWLG